MNEVIEYNPNEQSGFALILPTTQPKDPFAALFNTAYHSADEKMHVLWMALRDAWLNTKLSKSGSEHTIRSYQTATVEWFDYLATQIKPDGSTVKAWEVTANHVRNWQNHLLNSRGLAPSSVNQRLAACSSFYSFVTRERGLVNEVEVTAFMDANGNNRSNPFAGSNVQRAKTERYGHARILSPKETSMLVSYLELHQNTLIGSRNYALLLTYLMTGYRNHEAVGLQWGAIRSNRNQPGAFVVEWRGKGDKSQSDPMPSRVYYAIVAWLKRSGRNPETMGSEEFIFTPIITHGQANLRNHKKTEAGRGHISEKQVLSILNNALKGAGVPGKMRVHDLRHTFAHRFRKTNPDLEALRERLHHESLATTGIYAREILDDPVDTWSEGLYQNLRFEF
ncbi:MAG TPA: tyrosine-type recombinase/integrase [Nitrospira sp.]|nr:tyrosine-type recombinase/integrase [Nitrospira sp.]